MKKHPQVFTQGTSVPNFNQIQPFLGSIDWPKVFGRTDGRTDRQSRHCQILAQLKNWEYLFKRIDLLCTKKADTDRTDSKLGKV